MMHVTSDRNDFFVDNIHDNTDIVTNSSIITTNSLLYSLLYILFCKIRIYILVYQLKRTLDLNI